MAKFDYLIVGAGLYGATFAHLAHKQGKKCLVIDKRPHLGGNLYCENVEGINVHKYGAHIFHTSNKQVWDFVNSIVEFNLRRINEQAPQWNLIGFFDDDITLIGTQNEYGEVLGGIEELNGWNKELSIVITIGSPHVISLIVEKITNNKILFPNIIDPTVDILDVANIRFGKGNVICAKCFISCRVELGNFNLLNVGVAIGHDSTIGDFNVIMPNVNISGGVSIGKENMLGVKATVLQYLKIGDNVKLGANSLLMRNAKNDNLYIGIPAKLMRL